ncbi:MAG TPA: hypothetical protein VM841_10845 [Actinomycetota bacterium]|nr:hypothetical protein [Actinomycetota bacterium]
MITAPARTRERTGHAPRVAVALVSAVLAALAPLPSAADETPDPRVRLTILRTTPAEGITVTATQPAIAHLPPLLTLINDTTALVTIHDPDGIPFLRVGPGGVEANPRSRHLGPAVRPNDPPPPSPGGPEPLWQKHESGNRLRWYEPRAAYDGHGPEDRTRRTTLKLFTIPGTAGETALAIEGAVMWDLPLGSVRASITGVEPPVDGVTAQVHHGLLPAIELRNTSGRTLEISGRDGKPFARIGPGGVELNERSPTYADTRRMPEPPPGEPSWIPHDTDVLIWLEKRAAFDGEVPESIQQRGKVTELGTWTVPARIEGEAIEIRGVVRWIPNPAPLAKRDEAGGGLPWWVAAAAAALVLGLGGVVALGRRRGE